MTTEPTFGSAIARNAVLRPNATALSFGGQSWTYAEFDAWIDNVARQLQRLGVRSGDRIAYRAAPRPEVFAAMFAVARIRATFVPVHSAAAPGEIAHVLEAVEPVGMIADARSWSVIRDQQLDRLRWTLDLDLDADGPRLALTGDIAVGEPIAAPTVDVGSDAGTDIAVIAATSGTSGGRPSYVPLSHANLLWSAVNGLAGLDLDDTDRTLITTPLSHIAVLSGLAHYTWMQGGSVVLAPGFSPDTFLDAVVELGITVAFAVPTMLELLARHPRFADLDPIRWLLCGGAPLPSATRQRYVECGIAVVGSYGLTETSAGVTYSSARPGAWPASGSGSVVPYAQIRVVDIDGAAVPPGRQGEILVRGPSVAAAYLGPDGSRVPAVDAEGWFHTGDCGSLDDRGRLTVSGRLKDTIITGGENVDPFEVEDELAKLPGVADVAVIGVAEPVWGQLVTAVVVAEDGAAPTLAQVRAWLEPTLSSFKIPRRLVVRADLPRGATGKILRQRLADDVGSAVS